MVDVLLEQALNEFYTSRNAQIIFSALDPLVIVQASEDIATSSPSMTYLSTCYLHMPLFPDLVLGLCHRLWNYLVQVGGGNAFSVISSDDLENRSENPLVQAAIEALVPLSKKSDPRLFLLIDAYCTDGCTKAECRELGLSRSLDRQALLDLLMVLLRESWIPRRSPSMYEGDHAKSLPRLLMHIEDIGYVAHCSPLDVAQFTAALLYLVDTLGDGFTLWLNVNDTDAGFVQEVRTALGRRFGLRITHDLTQ